MSDTRYQDDPVRREYVKEHARARHDRLRDDPEYKAQMRERGRRFDARNREMRNAKRRKRGQTAEAKAKAAVYAREWRKKNPGLRRGRNPETRDYTLILRADPCSYCDERSAEVDHIVAISDGGDRERENLTAVCPFCNRSKKNRRLLVWLARRAA